MLRFLEFGECRFGLGFIICGFAATGKPAFRP